MNFKNVIYILILAVALSNIAIAAPQHKPRIAYGESNWASKNWAGYAITPQNIVTDVKGSWIVPPVTCGKKNTYSSFWVGIDGFNSGTVEQIGTDSDCSSGRATYYSWYEFYPNPSYLIKMSVKPYDVMSAEVSYIGNDQFNLYLTDLTSGATYSTTGTVKGALRSSAEWIVEAPSMGRILPLANFGVADLGLYYTGLVNTNYATVETGTSSTISSFVNSVQEITMVDGSGLPKAQPSPLKVDGASFSTQWIRSN